ncbi:ATP-dependent exoDNAse (exonuclease V) beta subunit [Pseudomonas sp. GV105]|uniref:UvrD-helicase domain-containing protein n=1 Tax=Pseudomonas sp. GV105 TaxID=2135759 RepID=UPI000D37CA19|nr:UvrD-helicase domain-containing protein [Pseudomonas sp. GV105]PUB24640.1 ATP-dependent exoDNAse (exonuclease V) beta subunit [Pseudomonas sp. GV105]
MPKNAHITFISAGAGSGKTHRLTEILHQELLSQQVQPAGVIATTFTRKAAAELRERVRSHLLKKGEIGLATSMGQARIGTVNSVCGQLLERFAFEAGMPPQQRVLEENQAKVLLNQAVDRVLHGESMDTFLAIARRLGLEVTHQQGDYASNNWLDELRRLLDQLRTNDIDLDLARGFAVRNAEDMLEHFPTATKTDLSGELLRIIPDVLGQLIAAKSKIKLTADYVSLLMDFHRELLQGNARWSAWAKLAKSAPEAKLKPLVASLTETVARYAEHTDLHRDITVYLEQVFTLAIDALHVYGQSKLELGVLDFADQEHALLKLLDNPAVIQVLEQELDLVMVDEFQDTSPMQLAVFLKLSRFAKRVYWVGDIKQAIYGFRGSDCALMQAILNALPEMGGEKQVLRNSWRSRPELVELANEVFGPAFSSSLPPDEVQLIPTRADQLPGPAFANWLLDGSNAEQQVSALAEGIGQLVKNRHQVFDKTSKEIRDVQLGDITVLCYSHSNVAKVAAALAAAGMPCSTAQPGLLATAEATLALACLRRLNDPFDTLATAQIVSLAEAEEPESWVAERLRYLHAGHPKALWREQDVDDYRAHPLVAAVARLRADLPLLTPVEALQRLIAECDLPSRVTSWSTSPAQAQKRIANLDAIIDLAQQYEDLCRNGLGAASISGLVLWLGETASTNNDALATPALDAVQVMTHHASKGLEWPVVILMDLARDIGDRLWSVSSRSNSAFDPHKPLHDRFIRYWPWPLGKQQKVPLAEKFEQTSLAKTCREEAVEEAKRLLYVSMTRARDLLVIARSGRKTTGQWLDCVQAPWLMTAPGEQVLRLPSGKSLPADCRTLTAGNAPEPIAVAVQNLHWFAPLVVAKPRMQLSFQPSSSSTRSVTGAGEKCQIGTRIALQGSPEMSALGTAIHASLCLSFTDPSRPVVLDEVQRLLLSHEVHEHVSASQVINQLFALHAWIESRWPQAEAMAEYPVQQLLTSGQVLNGRIDLLLDTKDGWVLIDHKSNPSPEAQWERLAQEHAGQLDAYAQAIEAASGKPVTEAWLFLPTAAGAVRVF